MLVHNHCKGKKICKATAAEDTSAMALTLAAHMACCTGMS